VLIPVVPQAPAAEGAVMRLTPAELLARADLVVHGEVRSIAVQGDIREAIVVVTSTLKGEATATVRVRFSPGLEDSPTFEVRERVLLYLRRIGSGVFDTVGGAQGKLSR
jgi:hypothetical protein